VELTIDNCQQARRLIGFHAQTSCGTVKAARAINAR
jgi:hypothetical protein